MQTVRLCAAVGACVLAMTVTPGAQEGRTRQVPGEYPTIQAAVDAADPGDLIRVAGGVYNENVTITASSLRLRASSGVVIDGTGLAGTAVRIAGTSTVPLVGVELSGFEIRNFQHGVVAEQVVELWLHRNEIHHQSEMGMDLRTVRFSRVTENAVHSNGAAGITVRMGSARNIVRANRVNENGHAAGCGCVGSSDSSSSGILVTGALSEYNEVVENEVVGNNGWGIRIARPANSPLTGTLVAQNRVHGNARAGITVMGSAVAGNTIVQNNVTGNSIAGITTSMCYPFDLFDDTPINNTWARNQGTTPDEMK